MSIRLIKPSQEHMERASAFRQEFLDHGETYAVSGKHIFGRRHIFENVQINTGRGCFCTAEE